MADHRITDFVDQEAIDRLKELNGEMNAVKDTFVDVAKELLKGIRVKVDGIDDLERMASALAQQEQRAAEATETLSRNISEQKKVIGDTTATIARDLQERNKANRAVREQYDGQDKVKSLLEQLNGTYRQHLDALRKQNEEIKALSREQKILEQDYAAGIISEREYAEGMANVTGQLRMVKQEKATLETLMKNEERLANAVDGSYNQLSQQLELLKKAYKNMTEEEKNSPLGKDTLEAINGLDSHLKELSEDMGEHQRNVGDYAIAGKEMRKEMKDMALEIAYLTIQYRAMSDEERNSASGQELAAHIADLTERAGELKDAMGDASQAIANAASDTRGIDQVTQGLGLLVDGFGLAEGAAQMFGLTTEDLAEVQANLQAAIAASNALQSIQNALQSQSAIMQGVNLAQTKLRTAAEYMHAAAQGKGVIATKLATAAQWAFNAAASANPIGLLVIALVAAAAAVYGLVKAFQFFTGPSKDALQAYAEHKQALEDLHDTNDKLINRMKARGATEAELGNASLDAKKKEAQSAEILYYEAKKLYKKDSEEYKEALEAKNKAAEAYADEQEAQYNYLEKVAHDYEEEEKKERLGTYEYKRQLIQAELAQQIELAEKLREQGKITEEVYNNIVASVNKAAEMKTAKVDADESKDAADKAKKAADSAKKIAEERRKAVQAGEDALLNTIKDSLERQRKAENLAYDRKLKELQEKLAKLGAKEVEMRRAINNQIIGLNAAHAEALYGIEMSSAERANKAEAGLLALRLATVEKGGEEELSIRLAQLKNQQAAELLAVESQERAKTVTAEQAAEMRSAIAVKYADLNIETTEQMASAAVDIIQQRYANEATAADNAYAQQCADLKAHLAEELELAGDNEEKRAEADKEYERKSAEIAEVYAKKKAEAAIKMYEDVLKNENLSAEERASLETELAKAKIELENAVAQAAIDANKRIVDSDKEAMEKRMANAQKWLQVAADGLNAINDLASAVYDNKVKKIEDEQTAVSEASQKEQDSISRLVEQNVITQEEGEARKRATADKTARKNEELERKKQQLKYKQALWDKANSIAQIGIATAVAITQALPNIALAVIAGAMGAIQLATALATPIPKYAKGTDYHAGGLAIVGDAGEHEIVTIGSKMYITPDKPTLVDMPRGAQVFPNIADFEAPSGFAVDTTMLPDMPNVIVNNDYRALQADVRELAYLIKQQTKQQHRDASNAEFERWKLSKGL